MALLQHLHQVILVEKEITHLMTQSDTIDRMRE